MANPMSPDRRLEELRRVLLKPDTLTEQIRPIIAKVLTEEIQNSREEIAQAIAPVMGEALRRAGQSKDSRADIIKAIAPVMGEILRLAEENQSSREEIAQAIAPVIGEAFKSANNDSYSRDKIAQAISPMVGEALRRIDQTKGLHDEIATAITPAMVNEALRRIDKFESARVEVNQKMETVLNRIDQIEDDRTEIKRSMGETIERIEEIERVQEEVTKALMPLKDKAFAPVGGGSQEEIIEALHPIIDRMVQQAVSKTIKRMTGTILIRQATAPTLAQAQPVSASQPPNRRFIWLGLAILLLITSLALGWWMWQGRSNVTTQVTDPTSATSSLSVEAASELAGLRPATSEAEPMQTKPASISTLVAALTATVMPTDTPEVTPPPPVQTRLAQLTAVAASSATAEVSSIVEVSPTVEATTEPSPTSTTEKTLSSTHTATPALTATTVSTPTQTATPVLPVTGIVASSVYLRDAPNGNITTFLTEPDTEVIVLAQDGDWYKVVLNLTGQAEKMGWLQAQWVTLYTPLPPQLITPPAESSAE